MRVSIHQPTYFPWLGLLDKIAKSDLFIVLNDVQANKKSNQFRNEFFCEGKARLLTLPVDYKLGKKINELKFTTDSWRYDHPNILKNYYMKAPFFSREFEEVESLYHQYYNRPVDFVVATMLFAFNKLSIKVNLVFSEDLNVTGNKGEALIDICKKVNASKYISGLGGKNYLDEEILLKFKQENIELNWQRFNHPVYDQNPKFTFVEGLGFLDILFFTGTETAKKIFWNNMQTDDPASVN